jgi:hypothetical protein
MLVLLRCAQTGGSTVSRSDRHSFTGCGKLVCGEPTVYSLDCSDSGDTSPCASLVASARFSAACSAARILEMRAVRNIAKLNKFTFPARFGQ